MDQKTVRMFLRKRLAELLQRPFSIRMRRHIVMKDLAPAQFHNHEYIKDTESGCNHNEEVAGHHRLGVIANEGQPALARVGLTAGALPQILADRARRHPDTQLQFQLVGDVLLSPGWVFGGHLTDQRLDVFRQTGPSPWPRPPPPEQTESFAMP